MLPILQCGLSPLCLNLHLRKRQRDNVSGTVKAKLRILQLGFYLCFRCRSRMQEREVCLSNSLNWNCQLSFNDK